MPPGAFRQRPASRAPLIGCESGTLKRRFGMSIPRRARVLTALDTLLLGCLVQTLVVRAGEVPGTLTSTNRYSLHQQHDRDGIGKFYMGREIAGVMGHEAAPWLERLERPQQEHPDELVSDLRLRPGEVVADIGAGTGFYTRRLAQAVGPSGKVFAEDIQPEMVLMLINSMNRLGMTNVTPVLGTTTDPRLPSATLDLALMVDVYHEFDFPYEMVQAICRSLKPGGRLVFVEFRAEDPNVPIKPLHKMSEAQVKREMSVQPLDWVETLRTLPWQHVMVFKKRAG